MKGHTNAGVIALIGTLVFFGMFMFAVSMSDSTQTEPNVADQQPVQAESSETGSVAEEFQEGFLEGCSPEGRNDEYCNCMIDELESEYSYGEMIDLYQENPDELLDGAVQQCIDLVNYEAAIDQDYE